MACRVERRPLMKLSEHKKSLIFTSLITLFPIVIGLILWPQLPAEIATHFNSNGIPDDYSPKFFAVFGLPLLLFFAQWIGIAAIFADPKKNNIHPKIFGLILWLIPILSLILCSSTYFYALGVAIDFKILCMLFVGIVFILVGNYLPKCPQNYTIGIKLPWTLEDEENWNKTHRLSGYLWTLMGLAIILSSLFNYTWMILIAIIIGCIVPTIYSYILYISKKNKE